MTRSTENEPGETGFLNESQARSMDYLLGRMDPTEAAGYERQLAADRKTRDDIEENRMIMGLVRDAIQTPPGMDRAAQVKIPSVKRRLDSYTTPTPIGGFWNAVARINRSWAISAAVVIALLLGWNYFNATRSQKTGANKTNMIVASVPLDPLRVKTHGEQSWRGISGSHLDTVKGPAMLFTWGREIRGVLAENASLETASAQSMKLSRGTAWFWIEKGGKGLKIETPHGMFVVTATSFGVSVSDAETTVEVGEGEIAVQANSGGAETSVGPGMALVVSDAGLGPPVSRPRAHQPPAWVTEMLKQEGSAWAGGVLPSLTTEKH